MAFVYTPYALPMLIAALITAVVASYIWPRRHVPGAKPLLLIAVFIAVWSLGYAFEIMSPTLPQKIWWGKVQYLGIALTPYLWLWFAFVYSGQTKPRPWLITLLYWLALFPITTILLVFTNEWHGLVWAEIRLVTLNNGLTQLSIEYGLWFWAHFVTSYLFLLFGTVALLRGMWTKKGVYRSQLVALMVAIFAPWLSNILFFTNLSPIPGLDLTPFAFTITVIALAWSLFSYQLINIAPIARDLIIEEMREGVLVINHEGRIVDINRAAAHFVGLPDMQAVGKEALDVLAPWPDLLEKWQEGQEARGEITAGQQQYTFQIAPLIDASQQSLGHIITTRVRGTAVPAEPVITPTTTSFTPAPPQAAEPTKPTKTAIWQPLLDFFVPPMLADMAPLVGNSVILSQMLERAFTAMLRVAVGLVFVTLI
ncbi:MAG: PAS domain-containing protein, partial [Anaerolineales bacterium]|nr:PAS domain-containing protein [Anaerolineales bacterium]